MTRGGRVDGTFVIGPYLRARLSLSGLSARYLLTGTYLAVLLGIALGVQTFGWSATWSAVQVFPEQPAFIDMRTVQSAVVAVRQGVDPQQYNPGDRDGRVMDYPRVWLTIGELFDLETESSLRWFCLGMITLFAGVAVYLL